MAARIRSQADQNLASAYTVLEINHGLLSLAESLVVKGPLRALDAIHVATALTATSLTHESLQFWTADRRQAAAAEAEGLEVVLPG